MKVSFQHTKSRDFYTCYYIGGSTYIVISSYFILKPIIWKLFSWKTIIPRISLTLVLNHFLISCIHPKLFSTIYLKEMFLLCCRSWEVLCLKFKRNFKNYLVINWRLVIWKSFLTSSVRSKSFWTFKDKLPKILLLGLAYKYKCGCCNANYYGKTKHHFKVRIYEHLGISHLTGKNVNADSNKLSVIQEHLLHCNYFQSYGDFCIWTR